MVRPVKGSDSRGGRFVPGDSADELCDRRKYRVRLVAVGGVAAVGQGKNLDGTARLAGDGLDLRHGSVLVVESLNGEDGAGDAGEIFFDIPAAEIGMEPDVVPSPERAHGVAMMAGEFLGEIRSLESCFGFGDAGHAEIFNEDVRREKDQATHTVVRSGVDERDGGAIAVADKDWILDVESREQVGERFEPFVVHVRDVAGFGERVGVSRTIARVDADWASGGGCDTRGEVFPERDGAEAFVEENEFRCVLVVAGDAEHFEAAALYGEMEGASFVAGSVIHGEVSGSIRFSSSCTNFRL